MGPAQKGNLGVSSLAGTTLSDSTSSSLLTCRICRMCVIFKCNLCRSLKRNILFLPTGENLMMVVQAVLQQVLNMQLNPKLKDQNFLLDGSWSSASFRSGDEKRYLETAPVLIEDCLCVVEKRRLSLAFPRTRIQISRHIRRKSWEKTSKLRGLGDSEKDVF
ncbi:hypothetical protein TNCV_916981 [Trichonephila clavipes]|nr:hypothetical protein TNCV_916981 [Trichonephila clavipes]